ncbi:MAG: SRPBCC family protein [Dehalococcoidia bacterium]
MPSITREVVVTAPLRIVYDAWAQFETYPQFLEGVEEVSLVDAKRLRWRARPGEGGAAQEWDVAITEQAPDDRIRWQAEGGPVRSGAVMVDALDAGRTRVRMEIDVEAARDDEPEIAARTERDLQAFKGYVEARAS